MDLQFLVKYVKTLIKKNEVIENPKGELVAKVNNYFTSSFYDPQKEAFRIVEDGFKKNFVHVLFGFGTGYIAESLYARLGENEELVIIEPNEALFELVKKKRKLNCLDDKIKVMVVLPSNFIDLEIILNNKFKRFNNRVQLILSPNFEKIYPDFSKKVMQTIKERLMLEVININTLNLFSAQWQENFIGNLFNAFKAIPFKALVSKLSCPVVITSGGPSLIKQLPLLKEAKDRVFILCSGSTINTLLKYDITPDAIVTVDGGLPNYNHFKELNIDSVPIMYPLIVHKGIPKKHSGLQVVFNISEQSVITEWTNRILDSDIGVVQSGDSVANFCLDIACQLSSGPICIIGQDLAYTDRKSHAEGNLNHRNIDEDIINKRKMFMVKGYEGNKVLTDYVFLSMKKCFEIYIKKMKEIEGKNRIFNSTEGGALIEGMENIQFNTFLKKYCNENIQNEVEKLFTKKVLNKTKRNWNNFYSIIEREKNKYKSVRNVSKKATKILKEIDSNHPIFTKNHLKQLDLIDEELKGYLENQFLFYTLYSVIYKVNNNYLEKENESEIDTNKRIYLKSLELYKGIYSASKYAITYLEELLAKINEEITNEVKING